VKILIVGLGAIGQRHARNLREILGSEAELLVYREKHQTPFLSDRLTVAGNEDPETALGLDSCATLEEALKRKPAAVIVANPTSLHLRTALQAAEAGCDLFLEKPVSDSLAGTEILTRCVREKNLVTMVGYQWRFHPLLQRTRALMEEGHLGPLVSVRAVYGEYLPDWHPYEDYRRSYASRRELGGGVLLTQIHDFDYLGWLVGWPERLCCFGGKLSDLEIDVEDTASTLMWCRSGERSIPVHLHQDLIRKPGERSFEIVGLNGKLTGNMTTGQLLRFDREGGVVEESHAPKARNEIFLGEMSHFVECVRTQQPSRIPLEEGLKSLRVAVAAAESMEKQTVMEMKSYET
jgi:predicted dehydrogenase